MEVMQEQVQAIRQRLEEVRQRVDRACARVGRKPEEVTIIGVTKTFPVETVLAAYEAGLRHFGENRVQELVEKASVLPPRVQGGEVCWHLIGHLQRNKARKAFPLTDLFHALDSLRLASTLHRLGEEYDRRLPCLVEVNVSGEASKFGLAPEEVPAFLEALAPFSRLHVLGLMTVAAYHPDPEAVRPQFRRLRELFESCRELGLSHVDMRYLSMGMSHDFEVAVEEGATHVRLGTALFGPRRA